MFGTAQLPKFEDDQFWAFAGSALEEFAASVAPGASTPKPCAMPSRIALRLDPDGRSAADQSRARSDPHRGGTAAALHRADALLPRRSGLGRARYARHDPPASVHEMRTRLDHDAGAIGATSTSACSTCAENVLKKLDLPFRTMTLCTGDMGFASHEDLRHRGLAAGAGDVSRDFVAARSAAISRRAA